MNFYVTEPQIGAGMICLGLFLAACWGLYEYINRRDNKQRRENSKLNVLGTTLKDLRDEEERKWYLKTGRERE